MLPAACPGEIIMDSNNSTCWADVPYPCRTKVDPKDELGLCAQHRAELVELDELDPYSSSTRRY